MRSRLQRAFISVVAIGLALAHSARGQSLPDLLKGRWVFEGQDCKAGIALQLSGNTLRLIDAAGHVDRQQVTSRRPTGLATRTTASTHGQPIGKTWVYEVLAPGQISLTEANTGRSTDITRCPDMLPADATPRQIVEAIYDRYAASDEPNLPLSGEANVRAFFVPKLSDDILAFAAHSGRLPDGCKPTDPFVPGALGDYKLTALHMGGPPVPDGADHAVVQVSFSNFDRPQAVSINLDHTPAGWRIADVSPAPGQSFRTNIAACATPPN